MRSLPICLLLLPTLHAATPAHPVRVPLVFERNDGQADKQALFVSRGSGKTVFLTESEVVIVNGASGERISMQLPGSQRPKMVRGEEVLPGQANYMRGSDASKWQRGVPTYSKVRYSEVYPGIDLIFYGRGQELEYDFIVRAGADPSKIQLRFHDSQDRTVAADVDEHGDLRAGSLHFLKPALFQEQGGRRISVDGGYRASRGSVTFALAAYDHDRPLVIDPVLSFSTYIGGSGEEAIGGVAIDGSGNIYLTGNTNSLDFPIVGAEQPSLGGGNSDAFVMKLNPAGTQILYSTYLGGSGIDGGTAIAVDASQSAYIVGNTTSANFPTHNPIQASLLGTQDAFVSKLDPTGSRLVYSTYLGSSGGDFGYGIAVDASGNTFVAGQTGGSDFPTIAGAYQRTLTGGADAFITKLNSTGSAFVYSTLLGGNGGDSANCLAVDAAGNAYVGGVTRSTNFPLASPALSSPTDSFVTKLAASGSALIFSTYVPSTGFSYPKGLAVDAAGALYVALGNDPSVNPMVMVYSSAGQQIGSVAGSGAVLYGIALRPDGKEIELTGTNWPAANAQQVGPLGGLGDVFAASYAVQGYGNIALHNAVVFGGSQQDEGFAIASDAQGNPIIGGVSSSPDFPLANPIRSTEIGGDAFLTKVLFGSDMQLTMAGPAGVVVGNSATYTLTATNLGPTTAFSLQITDTLPAGLSLVSATPSQGTCTGTQTVTCTAQGVAAGNAVTVTVVAVVNATGRYTNSGSVSVSAFDSDSNGANNTASVATIGGYSLSVTGPNTLYGQKVTSSPAGITCQPTCSSVFASGTSVTLTASAPANHKFESWSGACTGTNPVCTVKMTGNLAVKATFVGF